jgi:hypothetical protein
LGGGCAKHTHFTVVSREPLTAAMFFIAAAAVVVAGFIFGICFIVGRAVGS